MHYFPSVKMKADEPQASPESADIGEIGEQEVAEPKATPKKEAKPKTLVEMFGSPGPSEASPFRHRPPSTVPFKSPIGRPEIQRAKEQVKREDAPEACRGLRDPAERKAIGIRG